MKKLIFIGVLLWGNFTLWSQKYEVELQVDSTKKLLLELFSDIDGKKLLTLPVAFQLTNKNNLVMMFGDGKNIDNGYSVWLFSSPRSLESLIRNNKNISSTKEFKNRYYNLDMFYNVPTYNMQYIRDYEFDSSYETVTRNPKPAFFQIDENTKNISLFLIVFVSRPTQKFQDLFFARAKIVELNIKIND